jgi:hypothetical protein
LQNESVEYIVPVIRNDLWGNDLYNILKSKFESGGGIFTEPIFYPTTTSDFSLTAQDIDFKAGAIKTPHPGAIVSIFMASFGEGTQILAEASSMTNIEDLRWYGSSAFALNGGLLTNTAAREFASQVKLTCPVIGTDSALLSSWQPVRNALEIKLKRMPEVYALTAYDALNLAVSTFESAGTDAQFTVLKATFEQLAATSTGITGPLSFDSSGDRQFALYDFWTPWKSDQAFAWKLTGRYFNQTGELEKY